jgi:3-oxoacyl-[acyl-carrier-protein] synthase I
MSKPKPSSPQPPLPPLPLALAIVAAGAVTSVGLSAASTCAAIRSALDNFQETHFVDERGEPLLGAAIPDDALEFPANLPPQVQEQLNDPATQVGGNLKLATLFTRAAQDCVQNYADVVCQGIEQLPPEIAQDLQAQAGLDTRHCALLLIGPEPSRPGFDITRLQACFDACQTALGHEFHPASAITQAGSPGLVTAMQLAHQLLAAKPSKGTVPLHTILIASVDSLLNTEDINDALSQGRLLSSDNSDGFIPGEASACLMIKRMSDWQEINQIKVQRDLPVSPVLRIAGLGAAQEMNDWHSGQYNTGQGLAAAMRMALLQANLQAHDLHHRLSDASGEEYFMDEATYAWGRVLRTPGPTGFSTPLSASCVGHIGAAASTINLSLGLDMIRKAWAVGPHMLFHYSSTHAARGALVTQGV